MLSKMLTLLNVSNSIPRRTQIWIAIWRIYALPNTAWLFTISREQKKSKALPKYASFTVNQTCLSAL